MSMETKVCSDCNEVKAVGEFSLNGNGNPYPRCKPCRSAYVSNRKKDYKNEPPEHERFIVQQLIDKGIPAQHGRDVQQFNHVDIVAYGCVRIEAKLLKRSSDHYGYYAGNTKTQRKNGWKADVLCVVHENELYFFNPDHSAFYLKNGELKAKIRYYVNPTSKHRAKGDALDKDDMIKAFNKFSLVEQAFRRWQIEHTKPATIQLELLPKAS